MSTDPTVLWTPSPEQVRSSQLWAFARGLGSVLPQVTPGDYASLHAWSVAHPDQFWSAAADFLGVRFHQEPTAILESTSVEHARWFPGATLNYAEHVLADVPGASALDPAVIATHEDGSVQSVSRDELRDLVARAGAGLRALGVGTGDVVAAMLPNGLEAIVGLLATASLGAVWTSCSPDFGPRAVIDRFGQLAPKVLLAVPGYRYGGKSFDITPALAEIVQALPGQVHCVLVGSDLPLEVPGACTWSGFTADPGALEFTPVPFEHPLWTLFTSGTTGAPKGIIQGHGGIALEHGKFWRLHHDAGPGSRVFWFSTTGWMLWNLVATSLASGATVVTYDGNPGFPEPGRLWNLVAEHGITHFGLSAPYVLACMKAQVPALPEQARQTLTTVYSTGAPLPEAGFTWLQEACGPQVQVSSISGGTDLCTAFLGTSPWQPVFSGEMSCALLGADVHAFDEANRPVIDQVGELVLTTPMPSMPVAFWGDADGQRLHDAYFADIPGAWRHGDWLRVTERGSYVIYGRSDSTLNRGGVRMGTSEFYAVVEEPDEVVEALVIDTSGLDEPGELLCFLVLGPGAELAAVEPGLRAALRENLSPRHVPDRFILVDAVPRTLNGKKCEVPVRRILRGEDPTRVANPGAMANPQTLEVFVRMAAERAG